MKPSNIDQVIKALEDIILTCEKTNNPLGYFAALYQRVTIKVKEGIENNFFDDGPRMEQLDVIFANRYIDAFHAYENNETITHSWKKSFDLSKAYWPIVLQHLMMGMNAHINLDLGLAAAEVSKGKNIADLENDFNKINEILSSLVGEVQEELANIWPTLKRILQRTQKVDDFLVDFSMELARGGAWRFANSIAATSADELDEAIKIRDQKVVEKAKLVTAPGWLVSAVLKVVRFGEQGTIADKIGQLRR